MSDPDGPTPDTSAEHRVVVVGPDGTPIGQMGPGGVVALAQALNAAGDTDKDTESRERNPVELVEQPAKVMRIGSMIKQLLDEVKSAPLDEASRARLREIHARSVHELESGLAPELVEELERLSLPFTEDSVPTDAELRIAQAQLVGWLEGLFHGIQTALFAQQVAARAQFEEMRRRSMPGGGMLPPGMLTEQQGEPESDGPSERSSGPYL